MKKERIFWGIFFIAAAVFLIVSKMGMTGDFDMWTLGLTIFIGAILIKCCLERNIAGILFSLAFLCILYAKQLGLEAITPWPVLGAALLGSIGVDFLFHPRKSTIKRHHDYDGNETMENVEGAQMNLDTSFGGSVKYVTSDDLQSVTLHCSFGSMKVYFDNALIQQREAVVSLDVNFAGVELYVPKSWNIVNQVSTSFGAVDEKGKCNTTGTPVLRLTGKVSFGGVEIKYI